VRSPGACVLSRAPQGTCTTLLPGARFKLPEFELKIRVELKPELELPKCYAENLS